MLTSKQYQEAFNMAMEAFKSDPYAGRSEGFNPYAPSCDEYRAWNEGWAYASNFYALATKANPLRDQDNRGSSFQPSDLQ
jgi:hypothetical protein